MATKSLLFIAFAQNGSNGQDREKLEETKLTVLEILGLKDHRSSS